MKSKLVSLSLLAALTASASPARAQCPSGVDGLAPGDGALGDTFGVSLALDGDRILVGATRADLAAGVEAGAAYVYARQGSSWVEEQKLTASDAQASAFFGAVALSGDTALVGAFGAGTVYVFERTGGVWGEVQKLVPNDSAPGDQFGLALALDGDRLLVGAPGHAHAGSGSGAGYVFERVAGGWVERARLVASQPGPGHSFGTSVALEGDRALLGEHQVFASPSGTGAAYVFDLAAGTWTETARVVAGDPQTADWFGGSVALSSDTALVGALAHSTAAGASTGAAYAFEKSGAAWTQITRLVASDAVASDRFGYGVALEAGIAVAGTPFSITGGAVYAFERGAAGWLPLRKILPPVGAAGAFGLRVLFDGDHLLVGATGNLGSPGEAYLLPPPAPVPVRYCAGAPNSTGAAARIEALCSTSVSADNLVLSAAPVPDTPGAFFYGSRSVQLPWGDGFRCVAGAHARLPFHTATGGVLTHALDLAHAPYPAVEITAGSSWNFQALYRDPAAGGAGFNTTDAIQLTFVP